MASLTSFSSDLLSAIESAQSSAQELLGLTAGRPGEFVEHINRYAHECREQGVVPTDDEIIGLGALLGNQYIREFGWHWVEAEWPDGQTAFAVVNEDQTVGSQTINWAYWVFHDGSEINFLLGFNMARAGDLPAGTPDEPIFLH